MSYLTLPKGIPDFSKAVISVLSVVPQASIDKARAQRNRIILKVTYSIISLRFGRNHSVGGFRFGRGGDH